MFKKIMMFIFVQAFLACVSHSQAVDSAQLTSISNRSKVFETYYLDNPDNKDPSVFGHMKTWHEEDFRVFEPTVSQEHNKRRLRTVYETLQHSFESGTVSFTKIAIAYLMYSFVSASEQHSFRSPEELDAAIGLIKEYFQEAGKTGYVSELTDHQKPLFSKFLRFGILIQFGNYDLHWLPYVSRTGLASFRTLNNLYGMRAPTLGVPLVKSTSFDGNLGQLQDAYAEHEINHGMCYDSNDSEIVPFYYAHYHIMNGIVRRISDPQTQLLSDFFLYELGHEADFGVHPNFSVQSVRPLSVRYTNFVEACDYALQSFCENTIYRHCVAQPLDFYWGNIPTKIYNYKTNEWTPYPHTKDEYYARVSPLIPFVNPRTQKLFSLTDLIVAKGIKKDVPVRREDVLTWICPDSLKLQVSSREETDTELLSYKLKIEGQTYNILLELAEYFNHQGFPFKVWEGDTFQADEMAGFMRQICDTFKREVGPHFNGFVWEHGQTR